MDDNSTSRVEDSRLSVNKKVVVVVVVVVVVMVVVVVGEPVSPIISMVAQSVIETQLLPL